MDIHVGDSVVVAFNDVELGHPSSPPEIEVQKGTVISLYIDGLVWVKLENGRTVAVYDDEFEEVSWFADAR